MVLGGCPQHGWPTDVDVFNDLLIPHPVLLQGLDKWVEVDHQEVDGLKASRSQGGHLVISITPCKEPAMDSGVQGLDATIEHLREFGDVLDWGDRQASLAQGGRGAAR